MTEQNYKYAIITGWNENDYGEVEIFWVAWRKKSKNSVYSVDVVETIKDEDVKKYLIFDTEDEAMDKLRQLEKGCNYDLNLVKLAHDEDFWFPDEIIKSDKIKAREAVEHAKGLKTYCRSHRTVNGDCKGCVFEDDVLMRRLCSGPLDWNFLET